MKLRYSQKSGPNCTASLAATTQSKRWGPRAKKAQYEGLVDLTALRSTSFLVAIHMDQDCDCSVRSDTSVAGQGWWARRTFFGVALRLHVCLQHLPNWTRFHLYPWSIQRMRRNTAVGPSLGLHFLLPNLSTESVGLSRRGIQGSLRLHSNAHSVFKTASSWGSSMAEVFMTPFDSWDISFRPSRSRVIVLYSKPPSNSDSEASVTHLLWPSPSYVVVVLLFWGPLHPAPK